MIVAGCGGFVGTCLRFLAGKLCSHLFAPASFPWGTFVVNVAGSFMIGLLLGAIGRNHSMSPQMSLFLITGICGGFTTFSAFSDDMYMLLQQRHWLSFGLYAGLSFALGLLMVWAGRSLVAKI